MEEMRLKSRSPVASQEVEAALLGLGDRRTGDGLSREGDSCRRVA